MTVSDRKSTEATVRRDQRTVQKGRNLKTHSLEKQSRSGEASNVLNVQDVVGLFVEYDYRVVVVSVEVPIEQVQRNSEIGEARTCDQVIDSRSRFIGWPVVVLEQLANSATVQVAEWCVVGTQYTMVSTSNEDKMLNSLVVMIPRII